MEKQVTRAWLANILGLVAGIVIIPIFYKPGKSGDAATEWYIAVGLLGIACCIPALIYFKRNIVAKHDFSDGGLGLIQPMKAWSTIALLPFMAGIFHYIKTGNLALYFFFSICSCALIAFFKPNPKNT